MSTKTKIYSSTQVGAPVLSGSAGALVALLDAALVNGWGSQSATSLVVAGGIATISFATVHSAQVDGVVLVAGATPSGLNGEKRVVSAAAQSFTFDATGIADTTATGTITSKVAAAGWAKLFSGTNLAAYKPTSVESTGCVLRVDDTSTLTARVIGYETMTDIATGLGAYPLDGQQSGGLYWGKSNVANATPRNWMIFADDQSMMIWTAPNVTYQTHGTLLGWGDFLSEKSGDAFGSAIFGTLTATDATSSGSAQLGCIGYGSAASGGSGVFVARAATAIGGSVAVKKCSAYNLGQAYSGSPTYNANALAYPNSADYSLRVSPVELLGSDGFRGRVAGAYHTPQLLGEAFLTGAKVQGEGVFAGRKLLAVRTGATGAALTSAGTAWVDISGPWRV